MERAAQEPAIGFVPEGLDERKRRPAFAEELRLEQALVVLSVRVGVRDDAATDTERAFVPFDRQRPDGDVERGAAVGREASDRTAIEAARRLFQLAG